MGKYKGTIEAEWRSHQANVLPSSAPKIQIDECRLAFWAGAAAVFKLIADLGDNSVSEEDGCKTMDALQSELRNFKPNR